MIIVYICCRFCFGRLPLVFEFTHALPLSPFDTLAGFHQFILWYFAKQFYDMAESSMLNCRLLLACCVCLRLCLSVYLHLYCECIRFAATWKQIVLFGFIFGTLDWIPNRRRPTNHFGLAVMFVLDDRIFDRYAATKLPSIGRKSRVLSAVYPFDLYRNGTAYPLDYHICVRRQCTPTWCPNYCDKHWTVDLPWSTSNRHLESSEIQFHKLRLILCSVRPRIRERNKLLQNLTNENWIFFTNCRRKRNLHLRKLLGFCGDFFFIGHRASTLVTWLCLNRTIIGVSCARLSYGNRKRKKSKTSWRSFNLFKSTTSF